LALLLPVTSKQDLTSTLRIFLCRQASHSSSTLIPIISLPYHHSLHCCGHNVFRAADGHRTLLCLPRVGRQTSHPHLVSLSRLIILALQASVCSIHLAIRMASLQKVLSRIITPVLSCLALPPSSR
jgi:hypothetical protein